MRDLDYRLEQSRSITTDLPGPLSQAADAKRSAFVARALQPGLPGYVAEADGGILRDLDGNQFIDFASGIAVTSVGASNAKVAEAVAAQAAALTHTCFMVSPYESYVAVAKQLAALTPGDFPKKSVLLNSGAEAVENAVKIARAYTGKNGVVVFDRSYHGRTNLTMAMTAKHKPYKTGFGPFAPDVYRMPASYPLRDKLSGPEAAAIAITRMEQEVGVDNLACIVIEPIQGEGGFIDFAPGFLPALSEWCTANGVVFVADEIQAGFCRTGEWFAVNHEGVVPDLITTAKGIAGGLPLSAVTGRAEIMDAPVVGGLGGTYGGNPVACAAALATIDYMREHDLNARAREMESIIREELSPLLSLPGVLELRGRGAMMAIELADATPVPQIIARAKAEGLLLLSCGLDGTVIRLLPSLVIPEALLREGLSLLRTFTQEALNV
ncbi:MAG: 4-aminobutyrate--2-oxoglutarate transaminase [Corynebacterium sp.]|nr:4-aminobutyrate--2-oxoglutarate transaminase [Corynebacterium sp.]